MVLLGNVGAVFEVNFWVCGVSTMWRAFRRAGWSVGRERGVRLMRIAGIRGVAEAGPLRPPGGAKTRVGAQTISHARSRPIGRTACGSPTSPREREVPLVRAKVGFVYTAFVTDAFPTRSWAAPPQRSRHRVQDNTCDTSALQPPSP